MEKKYEFTIDIQRKIVAMLFSDEKAFKENLEFIKPEYFENPPLREIVVILRNFFDRYGKIPTDDEFLEELETFINKEVKRHKNFPIDEYLDTAKKVTDFRRNTDFDYVKDKVVDFARSQALKHAILEAVDKLKKKDFEGIVRDINEAANVGSLESEVKCLADIEAEKVKWLWEDRIPVGKLSLLVGDPGVGKSFFTIFLASRISRGESWPDCTNKPMERGRVLLLSAEDSPRDTIRPRADLAKADVTNIDIVECSKDKSGRIRLFNLTQDINRLDEMLKKDKNYRLVVIDPLSAYVGRIDTHKDSDVRSTLGPLSFLAEKYNVSVLGVLHFNKNSSLKAIYRILGSIGFIAAARTVWLIARDRDDENEKRRFFAPIRNNLAPPTKPLAFCIEKGRLIFESMPIENFDIEEVLAPVERASETKRAKDFLLDILRNGAMPMKEIKSTAKDEGISWATLRRTKEKMNIKSFKEGGIGGKWFWKLVEVDRLQRLAEEEAEKRTKSEEEN